MAESNLSLSLAHLLVAAAWVDDDLHPRERTYLIKALDSLPGITGADCAAVAKLLDSPMELEARERAVKEVMEAIRTDSDKKLVLDLLSGMIAADGIVKPPELELVDEVRKALDDRSTGVLGRLSRLLLALVRRPEFEEGELS